MAEFWPENQSEPSSAKIVKPASSDSIVAAQSQSGADDPPTVLTSFKPASAIPGQRRASIVHELAGEMLSHFRIDDYIGVGGMGAVFRATDIRLDRAVALKILPPEQAKEPEVVARFQHEARAAARLDHENVARVFFVGEDRGLHFIAFEFVEGVNVRDLIQQCGPLPPHEVVNYALQISGALIHAALRGVVHRDIKPSNIIITLNGRAKLVDMGLARHFERRTDGGLTQSGVTLGTFDYISPEQARDPRSADVRSDIYSLGCTLFHMLAGQPPFPDGTVLQKLLKHQEDAPPDPRHFNLRVPENLAGLVLRLMAKDPLRRYQTPQLLLSDLLELAAGMGLRSSSPEGLIWVSDQPRTTTKLTWAVWVCAAAALVMAAVGIYGWPGAPTGTYWPTAATASKDLTFPDVPKSAAPSLPGEMTNNLTVAPAPESSTDVDPPGREDPSIPAATTDGVKPASEVPTPSIEPQVISVGRDQDLRTILEQAPSGSIIEISGDYRPQVLHRVDDTAGIRVDGKRLTVRAAPGTRPRIMLACDEQAVLVTDWTLLTLVGSQLELEGIHFEVSADGANPPLMIILALESSQVTLRRCSFFQAVRPPAGTAATRAGGSLAWVAHLDSGIGIGGQVFASKVVANECFFGGGDGAFYLDGPAKLEINECTLLPYRSAVLVKSVGFPQSLAAEIRLTNVSWFGGDNPIFDLMFSRAVVHCQDVVFTHESPTQGILTRVDADSRVDWKGKHNVYHGLKHYFVTRLGNDALPLASRLSDWKELSREVEDQDSTVVESSPWMITLAEAAAKNADDPHIADAFRLQHDPADIAWRPPGARFVLPWGSLYSLSAPELPPIGKKTAEFATTDSPAAVAPDLPKRTQSNDARSERPARTDSVPGTNKSPGESASVAGAKLDMKKIMTSGNSGDATAAAAGSSNPATGSAVDSAGVPVMPKDSLVVDPQNPAAFHTLAAACARAEDGAVIEVRFQGQLREGPIELGDRHLTIRAAQGFRPTLVFVVDQLDLRGREPRLFDIRRGSLTLRDLDFVVNVNAAVGAEIWSVVASRGADVMLEGCTVTVEAASGLMSTVVRFLASESEDPMAAPMTELNPTRPQLQLRNCLAVGSACLVRIQPAVRVRVELENSAIEVQESFMLVAGGSEKSAQGTNELEIRRSTVKTHHTLVSYEANEMRAWLPRLEISTADNIFVGATATAWIRFKSTRPADELRGLLRWKGMNNSYAAVELFWEIESMTSGDSERYSWDEWLNSPARDEIKAEQGVMDFVEPADANQPWLRTRSHFKLSPSRTAAGASDGGNRGADLSAIPAPPQEREERR